jgi:hypothetical protein
MPVLSRWFIKAGFLALGTALLLELLQLRPAGMLARLPDSVVRLATIHLLTVGWLLQLIIGVAFWMFPRHPTSPPRGDVRYGWWAFGLLNTGLLLRLLGEPWRLGFSGPAWPLVAAGLLQLAGVASALALLWPRIRATGS